MSDRPRSARTNAGAKERANAGGRSAVTLLSDNDLYLFNEGSHIALAGHLGAHPMTADGADGTYFAVWAPNAERVRVVGDFNGWAPDGPALQPRGRSGIWEGFVPGIGRGALYKYRIDSRHQGYHVEKADPFAFYAEVPPRTGSIVWDLAYDWADGDWMVARAAANSLRAPIAIYELHLGSWRRNMADGARSLTYRELAAELPAYVRSLGFTHVEFLPVMEHPFFGSWGYQTTGYFAPTSRYGAPQDLMYLIDALHQHGIGVILDWVPSHFPTDEHGLGYFDGTHLYEHADARQGFHPDWKSFIFNYGRPEVRSFLLSNALFWLDAYHADGLRVDAVASMLYLDYSRKAGEWIPNRHGGRENLDAIAFLRRFNEEVYRAHPDVQTYAEESTAWPMVSRPTYVGGLGFGAKWDMGWMHDTLRYMSREPVHRRFHHHELTFRMLYAFNENFVLPLSHDEVVHGKRSLLEKMPGDDWQKHANMRLLFGYMYGQAGKKLLFMGDELAQPGEWQHDESVAWHLLETAASRGVQACVRDLNRLYADEPALHELDCDTAGFEWVDANDADHSVISFLRRASPSLADPAREGTPRASRGEAPTGAARQMPPSHPVDEAAAEVLVACNFTPVPRHGYRIGVPRAGLWRELLNTDAQEYGGSGQGNFGGVEARPLPAHGRPYSIAVTLPPLAVVFFKAPQ